MYWAFINGNLGNHNKKAVNQYVIHLNHCLVYGFFVSSDTDLQNIIYKGRNK